MGRNRIGWPDDALLLTIGWPEEDFGLSACC